MATHKQIEANRRNAELSTGPKTEEGKAISRANAYKHGLSGEGPVVLDVQAAKVEERIEEWRAEYADDVQAMGADGEFLFREMVACSVQLEAARVREFSFYATIRGRAMTFWNADHRHLAQSIGENVINGKSPDLALARLETFLQGIEWLLDQWNYLRHLLEEGLELDEKATELYNALQGKMSRRRTTGGITPRKEALPTVMAFLEVLSRNLEGARKMDVYNQSLAEREGVDRDHLREERLICRYGDRAFKRFFSLRKQLKERRTETHSANEQVAEAPRVSHLEHSKSMIQMMEDQLADEEAKMNAPKKVLHSKEYVANFKAQYQEYVNSRNEDQQTKSQNEPNGKVDKLERIMSRPVAQGNTEGVRISPARV